MPSVQRKKHGRWKVFLLLLSLALLPCTFSAWSYLRVLLPVSVEMSRAIPHVQECLNEPLFVICRLDAGKLRSSGLLFWLNSLWNSNIAFKSPVTKLSRSHTEFSHLNCLFDHINVTPFWGTWAFFFLQTMGHEQIVKTYWSSWKLALTTLMLSALILVE